jgi:hypothetical protein
MKELSFSTKTKFWPVEIKDGQGVSVKYELREMRAIARDKYMDRLAKRLVLDAKGNVVSLKSYDGMQTDLLTQCLFLDGTAVPISKEVLDTWPASTVGALFTAAQELNLFRKPSERNHILAEQLAKWFKDTFSLSSEDIVVNAEAIEAVIEETDQKLFDTQDEAAG